MSTGFRNSTLGRYGETVALRHLLADGLVLVDRNWTCPSGELDLVLRDGDVLVVCEVKTRSSVAFGHPLEAVGDDKLGRIRRLADLWVEAHGVRPGGVRIDLVGVLRPRRGPAVVEHVAGVA
jgi:putative endonuclease